MIKHRIYARHSAEVPREERLSIPLIKRCIRETMRLESVDMPCELGVLITDDRGIRLINREFRNMDVATDVLSFPMQEFSPPGWGEVDYENIDPQTGILMLGDIVLSAQRIGKQAIENDNTLEEETMYLTVHSILHLLGYDHLDEAEEKKKMREREKLIMHELGLRKRNLT